MKFLFCLILFVGCHKQSYDIDHKLCKMSNYPNLERYVKLRNIDLKQCPKDVTWQDYVFDYSESHGPSLDLDQKKEYTKFKVK